MISIKHRFTNATLCEFDVETIRRLFTYSDGELIRKTTQGNKSAGTVAGFTHSNGKKRCVKINGKTYLLHRIVFAYHHGYTPQCIDHIDGDVNNNRIENLRPATHSQNMCNRSGSGLLHKGVKAHNGKWQVRIQINGVRKTIGTFDSIGAAENAYREAAVKEHGAYAKW